MDCIPEPSIRGDAQADFGKEKERELHSIHLITYLGNNYR
jgi:hypothetical protein